MPKPAEALAVVVLAWLRSDSLHLRAALADGERLGLALVGVAADDARLHHAPVESGAAAWKYGRTESGAWSGALTLRSSSRCMQGTPSPRKAAATARALAGSTPARPTR